LESILFEDEMGRSGGLRKRRQKRQEN
jgi:hypothetical protein